MLTIMLSGTTWAFLGLQLYHYIGYPLVLLMLTRLVRRRPRTEEITPSVTLITAAYNEETVIGRKLDNSLALDFPGLEIIVVSDGSTDQTDSIVEGYASRGVRSLYLPVRSGKPTALNLAARKAIGEILVISDANSILDRHAIRWLVQKFADSSVGCACGYVGVSVEGGEGPIARSEGLYWRYEAFIRQGESLIGASVGTTGALMAIRRSLFSAIPVRMINDDLYLTLHVLRSGYRSVFEPAARAWRVPSCSFVDEAKRRRRIVDGRLQQLLKWESWPWRSPLAVFALFSHKFLRLLLPYCMIGAFAANAMLFLWPPVSVPMQLTFVAQVAFYVFAGIGYVAERYGRKWRIPAVAYYVVAGNAISLGGLWRHLRGHSSVLWDRVAR